MPTAVAEEIAACAALDVAGWAGLDMVGGEESETGAFGVTDALGVTDAETTDDNCGAAAMSALRDRH